MKPCKGSARGRPLYTTLDFVTLRAPILPIESYLALNGVSSFEALKTSEPTMTRLARSDARVRRALAIGSPSLLQALDKTPLDDKKNKQLRAKLTRFLIRMSMRPTPFGAFAGVALTRWAEQTNISLDGVFTRTRLDMEWLLPYVITLESQSAIRNQIRWVANSGAWIHHGRIIINERGPSYTGRVRPGPLGVSISATSAVRRALSLAQNPILYRDLVTELVAGRGPAITEKVESFLQKLWEQGFFQTELFPPLTVDDPAQWVCNKLKNIPAATAARIQLEALLHSIKGCDSAPLETMPDALKRAVTHASPLSGSNITMPLQVDTALKLKGCGIASSVAAEAARTAELLLRVTPMPNGPSNTAGYRQAFLARYGPDREVPLLELLHSEWGLGPIGRHSAPEPGIDRTQSAQRAHTLQHLALSAIHDGRLVIDLDEPLVSRLQTTVLQPASLPISLDLNLFVLATSAAEIDAGNFQLAVGPNLGAPQAGRNLGRFAHVLGPKAHAALARAALREAVLDPERISVEAVCLPRKFHAANVIIRPAVRRYEVVQDVGAGVRPENVVPLNELSVGVRDDRLYVRWVPRNLELTFTAGHMVNPSQVSAECRFLLEVSRDGMSHLAYFDWGPANSYVFLPRVQSGRSILRGAQWRLEPFLLQKETPIDSHTAFADWLWGWRERWRVPRYVYLTAADNRLLYDLENVPQIDDLRNQLRSSGQHGQCVLQEALPGPEHAWLESPKGEHHVVELVTSLVLNAEPPHSLRKSDVKPERSVLVERFRYEERLRPPGSDWLYLKLYTPRSSQDDVIAGPLRELCTDLVQVATISQWFFVRYADPEPHLRVRFKGEPQELLEAGLPRICRWASALVHEGSCQKFGFETYDRELERYGGPEGMTLAEALFAADSRAVADLLACPGTVERMVLTIASIDDLLKSIGLDEAQRLALLKQIVTSRKEASEEYRLRRNVLISIVQEPTRMGEAIAHVLEARRTALVPINESLAAMEENGKLSQPLAKLCNSYIHMHCNRLWNDPAVERRVLALLFRTRAALAHLEKTPAEEQSLATLKAGVA